MAPARLALYQALITGPLLAAVLVGLLLTRKRVLGYIRASSWRAVIGWWLLGILPWVLATQVQSFVIVGTNWFSRAVVFAFGFLVPLTVFALPFFALGATGVWTHSRSRKVRDRDIAARGA